MVKQIIAAALIAAGAGLGATGTVQAQEKQYNQVGDWKIIAIKEKGKFHRCAAELVSNGGVLRVAGFPNATWNVSVPCYGLKTNGEVEFRVGGEIGRVAMKTNERGCRTFSGSLDPAWTGLFRDNATLTVGLAKGAQPTWPLRDVKNAMESVRFCVKAKGN